jgi:tetratricopeptide (TPR) repeat protein
LQFDPDNGDSLARCGCVLTKLQRYEAALTSFENALKSDPSDWDSLTRRGNVLVQLHRYEEALDSFDRALDLNPAFAPAFYDKACCYALQGNIDRSIENLVRSHYLSPEEVCKHANTDPDLDSIRADDRFKELVHST